MTEYRQYAVPKDRADEVENAIDAVDDLEDVYVDRTPGPKPDGAISAGEAVARIAAAYTGWSK